MIVFSVYVPGKGYWVKAPYAADKKKWQFAPEPTLSTLYASQHFALAKAKVLGGGVIIYDMRLARI